MNLTRKQWRITELVAEGMKNKDIGKILGTTDNMIKKYLKVIFDQTGMNSRLELALWYLHWEMEVRHANTYTDSVEHHRNRSGSTLSGTDAGRSACLSDVDRVNHHGSHI
jgi:DNA-binding CsgD family transcriptional regulator